MILLALFTLGIAGLWIGTEFVVSAAARVAQRLHISHAVIGLTILAIGTDLPELVVAISAGTDKLGGADTSGIALGNAVGSAIVNITFVLGVAGLTGMLSIGRRDFVRGGVATVIAITAAWVVVADGSVSRVEGALMVTGYTGYLLFLLTAGRTTAGDTEEMSTRPGWLDATSLIAGLAIVVGGAELVVDNGIELAESWNVDQTLISVLVIAVGTSLPELAVSLRAAVEGKPGLSVGNIVGSNIFNVLVPIGVAAMIAGLEVDRTIALFDLPVLFAVSALALVLLTVGGRLRRREALALIGAYVLFAGVRAGLEAL